MLPVEGATNKQVHELEGWEGLYIIQGTAATHHHHEGGRGQGVWVCEGVLQKLAEEPAAGA